MAPHKFFNYIPQMKLPANRILTTIFFLVLIITANYTQAQKSAFYSSETDKSFDLNDFGIEVYNLNFIKNNEYFNFISDGLTLLGSQIHPEIIYNNSNQTQFRTGIFLAKNFGENKLDKAIPTFSFRYINKKHRITIGNLFSRDNHDLIEPLMASEKILSSQVLETGIQYKYKSKVLNSDIWLDWENYIRKYSEDREVFTVGAVSKVLIVKNLYLPVQYIINHKGGQINKRYRGPNGPPVISVISNVSFGLEYNKLDSLNNGFVLSYHFLQHAANSILLEYPFKTGNAHYLTLNYVVNNFNFLLGYYIANKFVSAKGNEMFQTYSLKSNINYWEGVVDNRYIGLTEPNRNLIFSKIFYEKLIASNTKLGLQLEGFFQLNDSPDLLGIEKNKKHQFDYSFGIYLIFNEVFNFKNK